MAGKNRIEVEVASTYDDKGAKAAIKDAEKLDKIDPEVEVSANVSDVLDAFDDVVVEAKRVEAAADALGRALGPELAAKADTTAIVQELQRAGITIEEIIADADRLGAKLKEVADADVGGNLGRNLGTARGQIEGMSDSARGANSALANMVGNSAQDLGDLGGIAGSAGVAIGQMAEYAADAALGGEAVGTALLSMAGVAVPILALTVGVQALNSVMHQGEADAKAIAEATEEYATALIHVADAGDNIQDAFAQTATTKADEFISGLGEKTKPTLAALEALGLQYDDIVQAFQTGTGPVADALAQYREMAVEIDRIKFNEFVDTGDALILYSQRTNQVTADVKARYEAGKVLNDALKNEAALSAEGATNAAAVIQYRDGLTVAAQRQQLALARLNTEQDKDGQIARDHRPIQTAEQYVRAKQALIQAIRDQVAAGLVEAEAGLAVAAAIQAQIDAVIEYKVAVGEATDELDDLSESMDDIEAKSLSDVFDIGNKPLDALSSIQDINEAIRDFAAFLKDPNGLAGKVPDITSGLDVNAPDFLDKIKALRGPLQDQIEQMFAENGAFAAQALADQFVATIMQQTGLSEEFVREQWNIPKELSILIKPALDASDEAIARRMLNILQGIPDQGLIALSIETDLNNKKITPQEARVKVQEAFQDLHFDIPMNLVVPDPDRTIRDAEGQFAGRSVDVPVRFTVTADQLERAIAAGISVPGGSFGGAPVNNITNIYPNGATPPVVRGAITVDYNLNDDRQPT